MTKAPPRVFAVILMLIVVGLWLRHWWLGRPPAVSQGLPAVRLGEAPIHPGTPAVRFPKPLFLTLPNGLRVFVIEDHRQPYVQCALALPAGTLEEPKRGLAALTAAMMMEGTDRHTAPGLAAAIEQRGMTLSVYADLETTTLRCGGAASDFPQLLGLATEALLHPTFPDDRLMRLKVIAAANWRRTHSQSNYVVRQVSGPLFYGRTPYAQPEATQAEFDALGRRDILGFYRRSYRPGGSVLGIIGDVRPALVIEQLKDALGPWSAGTAPPAPPPVFPPPSPPRLHLVDWAGASDSSLFFETLTVARTSPDYVPLLVANRIFGGTSSSRLFQNLRETQGYTYGAFSRLTASSWPGLWQAWANVPDTQTASSLRSVSEELQKLADDPVPDEELDRAKRGLIGGLALSFERPDDVLDAEMEQVRDREPSDHWLAFTRQIQAVTPTDIRRVAKRYLTNNIQVIVIGPRRKIAESLRFVGPVEDFDARGNSMP